MPTLRALECTLDVKISDAHCVHEKNDAHVPKITKSDSLNFIIIIMEMGYCRVFVN